MAAADSAVKSKAGQIAIILLVVVVVGIVVFIVYKSTTFYSSIMETLGLKDDKDEEKANKDVAKGSEEGDKGGWFTSKYWTQGKSSGLQSTTEADKAAKQIYDSVGYTFDSPEDALGGIKTAKSKQQVSYIVDRFNKLYSKDMKGWMDLKFDTSEQKKILADIYNYVNNLPKEIK